ncbi:agmatinase [Halogeometricum borinquense]|uniref:Agmatinase n=1 Tax=Halogeometricum borinquense TaxID=60847 RepID=A0A6C0UIZ5_9EURY|nr:agmatinase [Halogeometricum borinquense]QIB75415.1 agmatinase [Halogeometricum borinquense]QIQ75682.1 agmatinase [Halogeometricum borinquense]
MFPGATASRDDAAYVVVGAPLDISTTFRPGTRFGPERIRRFARTFDDYDRRTDLHFSDCCVHDEGDIHPWDDAQEYVEWVAGTLRDVRFDDAVPLLLGGEHTVTYAGVDAVEPDVFVCLDAHLDLRSEYDGNEWSHATITRRVLDTLGAEEAIILGARTGSPEEWDRAEAEDVTVVAPEAVADFDFGDRLDGRSVYLSVDIDGADPAFAPGTGTPEPFGMAPREMRDVVRTVAPNADGFDVVEVNDRDDGQAASLGGKLLREFVFSHASAANEGGQDAENAE